MIYWDKRRDTMEEIIERGKVGRKRDKRDIRDWISDIIGGAESAPFTIESLGERYKEYWYDPTEVEFVKQELHNDYELWDKIKNSKVLEKRYPAWRREVKARFLQEHLKGVYQIAADENDKNRLAAIKFLCGTEFAGQKQEEKREKGRPSKAEIEGAKEEILREDKELDEVFRRIGKITGTTTTM